MPPDEQLAAELQQAITDGDRETVQSIGLQLGGFWALRTFARVHGIEIDLLEQVLDGQRPNFR